MASNGKKMFLAAALAGTALVSACKGGDGSASSSAPGGDAIKVGILHSLSGTMAISEVTVKNAEQLAIDEINASGGVLGKKIEAVVEDGASDPAIFAQKATKLIENDNVVDRVRRLDLGEPQGDAAGVREGRRTCSGIRSSSRATSARPTSCILARSPTSRRCRRMTGPRRRATRRSSWSGRTTSIRAPRT